jgi:uncharacterized damage-inducible protein DinB
MDLTDIKTMFTYNQWATERLLAVVEQLSPEQYRKEIGSSHGGVHGTLCHLAGAEDVWLKRWRGEPVAGILKAEDISSFEAFRAHWGAITQRMRQFSDGLTTDDAVRRDVVYRDLKGNEYRQPLYELVQHLINHSSFHRGQVVTMLRQLGVKPVDTDMVVFFRERRSR